ncbi:ABC transporter permease [Nocardia sp. NPDC058518]|uniref:ABC transporter permease n=1 Tax=Nocardia sp. NPDC058518 TaxID=3346534 RepID=UPI00366978ED
MNISATSFARPRLPRPKSPFNTFVAAVCAALTLLIIYPLVGTIWKLFSGAEGSVLDSLVDVYGNPRLPTVLSNTALVVGASIVVAVIVGTTLAWLNERTNARVGWSSDVLPVVSLLVPSTAGAIGWLLLGSPYVGYVNGALRNLGNLIGVGMPDLNIFSRPGMIFVYSLYLIPQVYLVVAAAMRNIDPAMEEAARVSGRRTMRVFLTVTLPAVRPAVISGALLALIYGLSMFSIPLIIGTQAEVPILTVEIVRMVTVDYPADLLGAALLSLLLLLAVLAMNSAARSVSKRGNHATIGGKASGQSVYRFGWGPKLLARIFMFGYVTIGCLLPVAALCLVALQPYWSGEFNINFQLDAFRGIFESGTQTALALRNSLGLAVITATICMGVAILVAYQIARAKRLGEPLNAVTKLPGTVSHVILAIAFLSVFAGPPFSLGGTVAILLLVYVVLYITQATVSAQSAALQVGKDLTEASLVAGRGPGETLRRISLPLMTPGIAAGWVFVVVLVIGDITASAILAGTNSPVVGFTMLSLFQNSTYTSLAAFATIVTLLSTVIVVTTLVWTNRSRDRLKR